jgi:predicted Zn-dependent peptidase
MSIKNNHHDTIKIHKFPNGFRVIYQKPKQTLPITSIHVFCKVGSILETDNVRGICHFLEHMCFKGTKKIIYPNEIFKNYDKIGAYINAYTEKEYTCYTVKCSDEFVENSTQIVSDMVLNSTIPKKEFMKEQKVVVEENIRNINDNEWFFFDKIIAIFYGGSSYAYPIDSIEYHPNDKILKYKDVLDWYKYFYHPENIVFSITSNISFSKIIRVLKNTDFVKIKPKYTESIFTLALPFPNLYLLPISTSTSTSTSTSLKKKQQKIRIDIFNKKGMSTNFVGVGFRTCNNKHPDKYPLDLLNHLLNELSGRLFTLLREDHGLTYRSSCMVEYKEHTGFFLIYVETDPQKTIYDGKSKKSGVLPIIIKLLSDLRKNGITNEELERFKGYMKGKHLMNLENIDNITNYNGIEYILSPLNEFNKEFIDYNDIYEKYIDKITKEQIQQVIDKYFIVENMIVYILGENENTPSIELVDKIVSKFHTY